MISAAAAALLAVLSFAAQAQLNPKEPPKEIQGVGVTEKLGEAIDLSLVFTTAEGEDAQLKRWFDGSKPVVLALVYYDCPIVCSTVLTKLLACFNELGFTVGEDFNAVVVSFDPTEGTPLAASVKAERLAGYTRPLTPEVREGWAFLTGTTANSRQLANQVGFGFKQIAGGEFSHSVSIMILSPEGRVSRYIHGFDYPPRDVELSLLDATDGKIAKSLGQILMHFCYRFDPTAGVYSLQAFRVMQIGGGVTVVALAALIGGLVAWERRRKRGALRLETSAAASPTGDQDSAGASRLAGAMR